MYFKIAGNNVKRSIKDYTIYFLTLTFAVCIFYSFNSLGQQQAMLQLSRIQAQYIKTLEMGMSFMSIFVSIILGGLIIYANNFLVKKRKKELGIYMTLGMSRYRISKILFFETFLIGLLSLVTGLGLGIIVSQGLSVFTSKLFEISMSSYTFVVSVSAIIKTSVYFSIIFVLVILFNTVVISKYKLIDMINASKKNEKLKLKNPTISIIIFIISLVILGSAYYFINKAGVNPSDNRFVISIILGCVGTFLFFFSLSGFILFMIEKNKSVYLKNLNIFITRQINSKINTNFISITVICLMLFLTISTLATGLSFKHAFEQGLVKVTPFDASARIEVNKDSKVRSIKEAFNIMEIKLDNNTKYTYYNNYRVKFDLAKLLEEYINSHTQQYFNYGGWKDVDAIKISEYNELRKLKGEKPINLNNDEVLITSNFQPLSETITNLLRDKNQLNLNNKFYRIKNKEIITDSTNNSGMAMNIFTLIVPDEILKDNEINQSFININYIGKDKKSIENKFFKLFSDFRDGKFKNKKYDFFVLGHTKNQLYEESKGVSTVILYIIIYIGIVFLLSSAAILALQQLSEASDSCDRYNSLRRIGVTEKMINKTIFIQTLVYFIMPLALALVHSDVAIGVVNNFVSIHGKPSIAGSALVTTSIFAVIYGGYFYATYIGYKNTVKSK
ncbi:ABC transporter permease [Clostridium botulinum]|uniref:ABC transporter permease n=2 Tax=Clostridium botulinum TaxID=1491 RepID=UPI00064CC4FE|nr:ABC transporter permease [Clostridium botulinum]KLU74864.1 ABC transporter [Clostridium botulinum V891]KOA91740.1 ABC transporter [Clostridium botulinum]MCD3204226.1 ABC transporter permease [Clostridium botulinum C/D]MCD3221480.1 ABC transporter permease [Clostridium botulinum C/D]MCD3232210.1 ABC transporter permease [Clostridium botulinum C/D]